MPPPDVHPEFLFTTCQVGAQQAVKDEMASNWPELRFAYSRPGFLTFRLPDDHRLAADFDLRSVFARAYGFSLGKVTGDTTDDLARAAWQVAGDRPHRAIHVWQRDTDEPGHKDFEPGITPLALQAYAALAVHAPFKVPPVMHTASRNQRVLDCVLVEPNEWWVGFHRARSVVSRYAGGFIPVQLPERIVSRTYLKMEEALRWSRLPIEPGEVCVEFGAAPGGASQSLLRHGLLVTGIDPAEIDPMVLEHPNFHHLKMRGADIRRREFAGVRWLVADMNVAPCYTLDVVEDIVTHGDVHIRGLILNLKLLDWRLVREVPEYLDRVRSWGYQDVRGRQLAHNRQEICVAALRRKAFRRLGRRRRKDRKPVASDR